MYRKSGRILAMATTALVTLAACEPVPPGIAVPPIPVPATEAPAPTTVPPTAPPTTGPAPGWTLVGGDEFDDTTVDAAKWKRYYNTYGDGNNEMACLTPDNVTESDGALKLTAKKQVKTCPNGSVRQYTSGFVGSREVGQYFPRYGRFEIRAKVPHAQGLWPAFWLRHRNGASVAEVDILEYFHSQAPGKGYATLHLDGRKNLSKNRVSFESSRSISGWHTWAAEISPDANGVRFEFFMDGALFHSYVDTQHNWTSADPAATWDIALNLAVGGTWIGGPDDTLGYLRDLNRCSLGGTTPSGCTTTDLNRVEWSDQAAATYEVDYVRVFTR